MMSLKRARDTSDYPLLPNKYFRSSTYVAPLGRTYTGRSLPINRSRTGYRNYRRRVGPYRVLTSNQRHTNPLYPRPECKIYDADQAGVSPPATSPVSINSSGTVVCVNQMLTGTGVQQFTGNQVTIKSVAMRFEVDLPPAPASQVPTSGRVMLIWDRQPNGTVASFTTIFSSASYLAFANVNTRERFVVLRNRQYSLSPNGTQTIFFEEYVPVNMTTTFTNGQSSAGVPQTGALLLVYIGDQSTAANQPTILGIVRVRYYDN